jgi:predicted 3-demethylubiquinone-9 3-methyltransferase (glyoxalase superfamily)
MTGSRILPYLWFADQAEEAVTFYVSLFANSRIADVSRYGAAGPLPEGTAMVVEFQLNGQDFMALNGSVPPGSQGQAPIALFVSCETQAEVDALWESLSAGGAKLPCGWLKDRYGISWNIVPAGLGELLGSPDRERARRAMQAMLAMEKLDINELRRAYDGDGG